MIEKSIQIQPQTRERSILTYVFLVWVLISLGLMYTTVSSLAQSERPAIPRTADEARLKLENPELFNVQNTQQADAVLVLNLIQGSALIASALGVWFMKRWSVFAYAGALAISVLANVVSEGRQSVLLIGVAMFVVLALLWRQGRLG